MLDEYLSACRSASRRSRWVFLATIIACILAAMMGWNSTEYSWKSSQARCALLAARIVKASEESNCQGIIDTLRLYYDSVFKNKKLEESEKVKAVDTLLSTRVEKYRTMLRLCYEDTAAIRQALFYLMGPPERLMDASQLADKFRMVEGYRVKTIVAVDVPFLGFYYDINDLTPIAGLSFFFLLAWLWYCLWRERDNLIIFDERTANKEFSQEAYDLLSMNQVITVPRRFGRRIIVSIRRYPGKILFALPFFVELFLWYNDYETRWIGYQVSVKATTGGAIIGFIALILIALLGLACVLLSVSCEHVLDRMFESRYLTPKRVLDVEK